MVSEPTQKEKWSALTIGGCLDVEKAGAGVIVRTSPAYSVQRRGVALCKGRGDISARRLRKSAAHAAAEPYVNATIGNWSSQTDFPEETELSLHRTVFSSSCPCEEPR